jgi:hypothetical protein
MSALISLASSTLTNKTKKLSKIRGKYSLKNGFKKDHQGQKKGGLKWDFKGSGGQR